MDQNDANSDHLLALQLQQQFHDELDSDLEESKIENSPNWKNPKYSSDSRTSRSIRSSECDDLDTSVMSLVDPRWELIDPVPDVRMLFLEFNDKYFWGRLAGIEVKWSPRMTLCAGLCVYEGRGGLCSVRLSAPLLKLRPRKDLIETLLHEMIHAYLFVTDNNKDHDGHGPEFHKHMHRLNTATGTNISVYHTFHDEVDNYRQHWWRCDGPCQSRPPYFGYVKRSMNRAPSPRDPWWPVHQQSCGGTYSKVKEPEGYGVKKKAEKEEKKWQLPPFTGGNNSLISAKGSLDIRLFGSSNSGTGVKKIPPTSATTKLNNLAGKDTSQSPVVVNGVLRPLNGITTGGGIHGFVQTERNRVDAVGSGDVRTNIHGFNEHRSSRNTNVSPGKRKVFSGVGKTLSEKATVSSQCSGSTVGSIVRKIPGIGIIPSERYLSVNDVVGRLDAAIPQLTDDKSLPRERSNTTNTSQSAFDYNSEDSEFDEFLESLLKPDFQKKKKKKKRKVMKPGFVSVCSKNHQVTNPTRSHVGGTSANPHRIEGRKSPEAGGKQSSADTIRENESVIKTGPSLSQFVTVSKRISMVTNPANDNELQEVIHRKQSSVDSLNENVSGLKTGRLSSQSVSVSGQISAISKLANDNKINKSTGIELLDSQTKFQQSTEVQKEKNHGLLSFIEKTLGGPKGTPKRKFPPDFAMDRNKRALDLAGSDSDSDIDENVTLGSVIKQKIERPMSQVMKRLKIDGVLIDAPASFNQSIPAYGGSSSHSTSSTVVMDVPATKFISCPVCETRIKEIYINEHLDACLS